MKRFHSLLYLLLIVVVALSFAGCKKKKAAPESIDAPSTGPTESMEPPPSVEQPTTEGPIMGDVFEEVTRQLQPVFYDYNRSEIREDQINALQNNARVLKANPSVTVLIEGHCDERGTDEYNLALGERRAQSSKDYLISLGIEDSRLSTISYGESRPFAQGSSEDAWSQNRRAHFVAVKK